MSEFTIQDIEYDFGKIDTFKALFVQRSITPFFQKISEEYSLDEVFAEIPEETLQGIFDRILPAVKRKVQDNWFPIYNTKAREFMYNDITPNVLTGIFFACIGQILNPL